MSQNLIEIFGKNVRKYMELKSMSIKELSQKTGISERYIKMIVTGNAKGARMSHGLKIARACEIKLHMLFEE